MHTILSTTTFRLCLLALVFALSGCAPDKSTSDPTARRISEHTVIKKVCLDNVSYYATEITDGMGSIAVQTYWVVGGPVFTKGNSVPDSCEK